MSSEIERMQKCLNAKELCPKRGYRRDVAIYELVCYVNNITGCYISDNLEPIRLFIDRARGYMEDNAGDEINKEYFGMVSRYLRMMDDHLKRRSL